MKNNKIKSSRRRKHSTKSSNFYNKGKKILNRLNRKTTQRERLKRERGQEKKSEETGERRAEIMDESATRLG